MTREESSGHGVKQQAGSVGRRLPIANTSYQLPALVYHGVGENDAALLNRAVAMIPMK
jgi:hypothetical protein